MSIGVFGLFRVGKPTARLAILIQRLIEEGRVPDAQLMLGTPSWQDDGSMSNLGAPVVDTSSFEAYYDFLKGIDVAVCAFDVQDYFYHPSGTMADAASCGAHLVCLDYPVFNNQINHPSRIGFTYQSQEDIEVATIKAIELRRSEGQNAHYTYRQGRSAAVTARLLDDYLSRTPSRSRQSTPAK